MKLRLKRWYFFAIAGLFAVGLIALLTFRHYTSVQVIRPPDNATAEVESPLTFAKEDRPFWRGPSTRDDTVIPATLPEWNAQEHLIWKIAVEGLGHSSPIVCGEKLFLTTADGESIRLLAFDRKTGGAIWNTELHRGGLMAKHEKNSHASATPACDGERIYAAYAANDAIHVVAVEPNGHIAWRREAGPFVSEWGYGSSVIIDGARIFVVGDNRGSKLGRIRATSFLTALDRSNGEIIWRIPRPEDRSYSTPHLAGNAESGTLIMAGPRGVFGYSKRNGDQFWNVPWAPTRSANSPDVVGGVAVISGAFPSKETLCLRWDKNAQGDRVVWRLKGIGGDVPSPLIVGKRVYVPEDNGVVVCVALDDGHTLWKERIASGGISSSPISIADKLYLADESGTIHEFRDADEYELIASHKLGEPILATPVVSDGRMYVRTMKHLWCFGRK